LAAQGGINVIVVGDGGREVISAANEWKGWWMTALTGGGGRGVGVMKEGGSGWVTWGGIVQKMCEGHGTT
jgi:hypothetical protein